MSHNAFRAAGVTLAAAVTLAMGAAPAHAADTDPSVAGPVTAAIDDVDLTTEPEVLGDTVATLHRGEIGQAEPENADGYRRVALPDGKRGWARSQDLADPLERCHQDRSGVCPGILDGSVKSIVQPLGWTPSTKRIVPVEVTAAANPKSNIVAQAGPGDALAVTGKVVGYRVEVRTAAGVTGWTWWKDAANGEVVGTPADAPGLPRPVRRCTAEYVAKSVTGDSESLPGGRQWGWCSVDKIGAGDRFRIQTDTGVTGWAAVKFVPTREDPEASASASASATPTASDATTLADDGAHDPADETSTVAAPATKQGGGPGAALPIGLGVLALIGAGGWWAMRRRQPVVPPAGPTTPPPPIQR